jgi:hypothetical protein
MPTTRVNQMKIFLSSVILSLAMLVNSQVAFAESTKVYEMRTYTAVPGRLPDVIKRFNDHTRKFFDKYNISSVGYWTPTDKPNTLVYIVAHASREDATKNWAAFSADPDWQAVRTASMTNGPIVEKIESVSINDVQGLLVNMFKNQELPTVAAIGRLENLVPYEHIKEKLIFN